MDVGHINVIGRLVTHNQPKKQQQARRFSLSREIVSEAHRSLIVCRGYDIFNEHFIF